MDQFLYSTGKPLDIVPEISILALSSSDFIYVDSLCESGKCSGIVPTLPHSSAKTYGSSACVEGSPGRIFHKMGKAAFPRLWGFY